MPKKQAALLLKRGKKKICLNDKTNNMLRVGNSIIVDFQSGLLRGNLPNGCNAENILNIYYVDNLSNKTMVKDDSEKHILMLRRKWERS